MEPLSEDQISRVKSIGGPGFPKVIPLVPIASVGKQLPLWMWVLVLVDVMQDIDILFGEKFASLDQKFMID